MTPTQKWVIAIHAVSSLGALLVVILAIWGDWVRSVLAAPGLRVALRNREGLMTFDKDGVPVRYYHLVVSNSRRWAPARNVIAYMTQMDRSEPDGRWQPAFQTGPVPLPWQFDQHHPGLPLIGYERICDLGFIAKGKPFELARRFQPYSLDPKLGAKQQLRAHVIAVADNGQSEPAVVEIAWDGEWADGATEMGAHLVVTLREAKA